MEYGLIGEHLPHSYSKEVHGKIAPYSYELKELSREELDAFMTERSFRAINVTIPYKQNVIPYLTEIDENARKIGAVNTVVNREGKLYGYNTDFSAMRSLILRNTDTLTGKTVVITGGDGGTARTAYAVAQSLGAGKIYRVSRRSADGFISYEEARRIDADAVINTTPVGMFPRVDELSMDISCYPRLSLVIDAIYNPIATELILSARERGIPAEGGLYMLVAQAVYASQIFQGLPLDDTAIDRVFSDILSEKENIYLIGMPGCGKSHVGQLIAKAMGRQVIDTDAVIVERAKMPITDIFEEHGESTFRDMEAKAIADISRDTRGAVISTGGGAILRSENIRAMRRSGKIYFIDRNIDNIKPTKSRPLSLDREALRKRYEERYEKYLAAADLTVVSDEIIEHTRDAIIKHFSRKP